MEWARGLQKQPNTGLSALTVHQDCQEGTSTTPGALTAHQYLAVALAVRAESQPLPLSKAVWILNCFFFGAPLR